MSVTVRIPTPLRNLTQNLEVVEVDGATVDEVIVALQNKYAGLRERICDEKGEVRRFVNVYLNDEDIRYLEGKATVVKDGDELSIVPAIAGGKE